MFLITSVQFLLLVATDWVAGRAAGGFTCSQLFKTAATAKHLSETLSSQNNAQSLKIFLNIIKKQSQLICKLIFPKHYVIFKSIIVLNICKRDANKYWNMKFWKNLLCLLWVEDFCVAFYLPSPQWTLD